MNEIYYKPNALWKGKTAITKLHEITGKSNQEIIEWLEKQSYWQIHKRPPKMIHRPHYEINKVGEMHQFDLLFMPGDIVYGNKYKYILTGIDVASRYKVARPLRTKKSSEVADMIKDIYKVGPLTYPKIFQCDNGGEFKGETRQILESHGVRVRAEVTKYNHSHTAFVESLNRVIAERLFRIQDAQELANDKTSTTWVKHLYSLVDELNKKVSEVTDMKPIDAIKKETVSQTINDYPPEEELPLDGIYRYLLKPGEEHNDTRRRETDNYWSRKTYSLEEVIKEKGNRIMYKLNGRTFVKEELMSIPYDTVSPPDWVSKW